ncbi:MAG: DUF2721 domain-containing protein [Planctomycetes bacterium]|nr:DUF2721 domain-containing protein [Planctomycetota bacterium]
MLQPIEVLAAMITPAVLISAAALVLLSTANRLGRVNDRLQGLMAEAERLQHPADAAATHGNKHELVLEQLTGLLDRLLLLRTAVTGIYVTIALLIVTSIAAGLCVAFPRLFGPISTSAGVLGAVAFLYSTVVLVQEASIAVKLTLREITYVRTLVERPASR